MKFHADEHVPDAVVFGLRRRGGVAYCHNQKYKVGQFLSKLLNLAARVSEEEIKNRVEFL